MVSAAGNIINTFLIKDVFLSQNRLGLPQHATL